MDQGSYRDGGQGAEKVRDSLLDQRRAAVALLPLSLRQLYVRRASWSVTGAVAALTGAIIGLGVSSPRAYAALAGLVPGDRPAPLSSSLLAGLVVAVLAYFVARSLAEDRFTRAMRDTVLATDDVYADLERLRHQRADDCAQRMARRLDTPAVLVPFVGLCMILPAVLGYALTALGHGVLFPNPAHLEHALLGWGGWLAVVQLVTGAAAVWLGLAATRRPRPTAPCLAYWLCAANAILLLGQFSAVAGWLCAFGLAILAWVSGGVVERVTAARELLDSVPEPGRPG